jgi:hypothetical protein
LIWTKGRMKKICAWVCLIALCACSAPGSRRVEPTGVTSPATEWQRPTAGVSPAADTAEPTPDGRRPYALGISLEAISYESRAFANMLKGDARVWKPGTMDLGPVDGNGMPTADFDLFVLDGEYIKETGGFQGVYTLYFNGEADVEAEGGALRNQRYDSAGNLTTAQLVVSDPYPSIWFNFRNTRRTAESAAGTGVTGLRLMRPIQIGGSESYPPDAVFTAEFLAIHDRGEVLRFMDFTATNGNIQRRWNDRNTPDDLTFFSGQADGYWWQGVGAPWEYAILLANTLDKDIWVNIPTLADDDYVANLADLLARTLEPERRIYVEYSNEIWNFGFPQWEQVTKLVDADLAADPRTSIDFDGLVRSGVPETDYGVGVPRYWARRILQISGIFRARFGGAAMPARVRPLFETQAAWQHWLATGLLFLDAYYNNGDGAAHSIHPRPISDYLWGGGGSGYVHGMPEGLADDPTATVDDIFAAYEKAWPEQYRTMAADVYWLSAFGLKRVAYEGGTGLDDFAGIESAVQKAQRDPRMEAVYRKNVDVFFEAGGDLYVTFLGVNSAHGLVPFDAVLGDQPTPKLNAFDEMLRAAERPAPTVGFPIPVVIPGGRYHVREDGWSAGESDGPIRLEGAYSWASYTIHAERAGTYRLAIDTAAGTGGKATLWVDGVAVAVGLDCPEDGGTKPVSITLAPGVHAIRVQAAAGGFDLVRIRIQ